MTENIKNEENLISTITDSLIQSIDLEISETENIKKLNLWIVGLSVGVELFIFSRISYSETTNWGTFLFILTGAAFMLNVLLGLYLNKVMVNVINLDIAEQRKLIHQKMMMIGLLNSTNNSNYIQKIAEDFHSGEITLKMKDLDYFSSVKETPQGKTIRRTSKKLNMLSENSATAILIFQFTATIILFFLY